MSRQSIGFNKALGEIAETLNSNLNTADQLQALIKTAAGALGVKGCSLMFLGPKRKRLIHAASCGLSERYLKKGLLEVERSLPEVLEGKTVAVLDAAVDPRIQFREFARQEHIVSMLGVPLKVKGEVMGSLRAYNRTRREFTTIEEEFLIAVANLAAIILEPGQFNGSEEYPLEAGAGELPHPVSLTSHIKPTTFAHPSEEELARLLDFYQIAWLYEPRSFPLQWENGGTTDMFTPDFYLPELDLYIEMTTMKPGLTREKKRKVRCLRELHPEVNIKLLARRDYDRLLANYGHGPLAGAKTRGVGRVLLSTAQIQARVRQIARDISRDYEGRHVVLIGVLRGVFCFMADLMRYLTIPADVDFMALSYYKGESGDAVRVTRGPDVNLDGRYVLLVEDIVDTGMTLSFVLSYLKERNPASLAVCTLLDKRVRRLVDSTLPYVGFEVPDEFLVGYGLDFQEEYRNLPFVALLEEKKNLEPEA
ncbi:hypoxanthine phosphoribosyltransferase [Chloroflexota bacterium]